MNLPGSGQVIAVGFGLEQHRDHARLAFRAVGHVPARKRAGTLSEQADADRRQHRHAARAGLGVVGIAEGDFLLLAGGRVFDLDSREGRMSATSSRSDKAGGMAPPASLPRRTKSSSVSVRSPRMVAGMKHSN